MKNKTISLTYKKEFIKFIFVGLLNTLITLSLYLILINIVPYKTSYTISYVLGIAISYILNSYIVFKTKICFTKFLKFPVVYLVQYIISFIVLYIVVEKLAIDARIAPLIAITITIPITFLLSRHIIKK